MCMFMKVLLVIYLLTIGLIGDCKQCSTHCEVGLCGPTFKLGHFIIILLRYIGVHAGEIYILWIPLFNFSVSHLATIIK